VSGIPRTNKNLCCIVVTVTIQTSKLLSYDGIIVGFVESSIKFVKKSETKFIITSSMFNTI
jgi:hypothetical protein